MLCVKIECDRKRVNVDSDRLSSLADDVIHKILSFISTKHAVGTSVLSSRWRFIWTSLPYLNFISEDFPSLLHFSKAVTSVLSRRNDRIEVDSLVLSLHGRVSLAFVKRILNYAFSHNVQRMTVTCLIEKKIELPLSLFRSRSLKSLTLIGSVDHLVESTWELPALTTLHLGYVTLYNEEEVEEDDDEHDDDDDNNIFSKCPNMKSLTLDGCKILGSNGLSICHPCLSNLTLENGNWGWNLVYLVVPQLKNLAIVNCDWVHLSAPDLTSFIYRSGYSLKFSTDSLPSLDEVDLCIRKPGETESDAIVGLLQQFHRVRYLTVNLETIEVLCSSVELISNQPSPFVNLRSLKIHPVDVQLAGQAQKKVVSNEIKSYLLGNSPRASFTLVTREEIKARDARLAQHLMTELTVMLEQDKANINWDHMERGKAPIENYWEDLTMQRSKVQKTKICDIISKLQHIEGLLTKLPTSDRAKMQSNFSSLCEEANLVMKKLGGTSIQPFKCLR